MLYPLNLLIHVDIQVTVTNQYQDIDIHTNCQLLDILYHRHTCIRIQYHGVMDHLVRVFYGIIDYEQ